MHNCVKLEARDSRLFLCRLLFFLFFCFKSEILRDAKINFEVLHPLMTCVHERKSAVVLELVEKLSPGMCGAYFLLAIRRIHRSEVLFCVQCFFVESFMRCNRRIKCDGFI